MKQVIDEGLAAVIKDEFDGLRVRILSDREAGQVVWESTFLDGSGEPMATVSRTLRPVELSILPQLLEMLEEATELLTPRSRPDKAQVRPPVS